MTLQDGVEEGGISNSGAKQCKPTLHAKLEIAALIPKVSTLGISAD